MTKAFTMDRRAYLATVGTTGVAMGVAGCLDGDGGGGGDTIVPGTASGFPPFEYTEGGDLVGFDVDLVEELVSRTDYELGEWTDIEFDTLIPSLTENDIDIAAAAMSITEERQETIAFSDPYYRSDQAVLVRDDDIEPEGFEDLEGATVGAQSGTTGEDIIQADLVDAGIISEDDYSGYDNYTLSVNDLENGNIDAVVIDIVVAESFAADYPIHIAFEIPTDEEYGLGMRQDDDRIEDINDALAEIREDGTYDELVESWFQ